MARTDAIVLGAGIVGTSVALQLARRGLSVALVDRAGVGEATSYGNSGVIEGSTILPPAFPSDLLHVARVALKRASDASYHWSHLPKVAPWLMAFRANSTPARLAANARANRPLFARALAEHEALMAEAGATHYLRKTGWMKLYRDARAFDALQREFEMAKEFGLPLDVLDAEGARKLEPSLNPVFKRAVFWPKAASLSNPLAVTRAYAARFGALGGVTVTGDARTLHRSGDRWRVETNEGGVDSNNVVVALGPWAPDLLEPMGLKLPMAFKRGYHRHFRAQGDATLARPVVDVRYGYLITPMEQGIRLTTGAEFAARDAPPTPVQFDRLMPHARRSVSSGRARRGQDLDGLAAVLSGFAAGDRPRPGHQRRLAGDRARPLGPDARADHRRAAGGHDDGGAAVLRSGGLCGGAVSLARCDFAEAVAIADFVIEEGALRSRGLEVGGQLGRDPGILIDAAGEEGHGQPLAALLILNVGNRGGRHGDRITRRRASGSATELVLPTRQRAGEGQGGRLVDAARDRARQHIGGERAELGQRQRRVGERLLPVAAANTTSPSSGVCTG